jgi:hypothetical protein
MDTLEINNTNKEAAIEVVSGYFDRSEKVAFSRAAAIQRLGELIFEISELIPLLPKTNIPELITTSLDTIKFKGW